MSNRIYASKVLSLLSAIVLLGAILFVLQPQRADAASLTGQLIKRLCERQAILGIRLPRPLIDPEICNPTPPPPAPTLEFSANPEAINAGQSSTLEWNSENASSCSASGGWSGSKSVDGTEIVSPSATTTYSLTCTGEGGTVTENATVNVVPNPVPTVTLSVNPTTVTPGPDSATSTLTWSTTNANLCLASGGWSGSRALSDSEIVEPNATTTYTLDCSNSTGTTTASATVNFVPPPAPPVDHILISEVFYDVDPAHGTNASGVDNNEWIELYNPTNATVDLSGWDILDNTLSDEIPQGTTLATGAYLVITATTTTEGFWDIPDGVQILVLDNQLGNGLSAGGDVVFLRNAGDTVIDSVSWFDNTQTFDPPAPDVLQGHSLFRSNLNVDTNTVSDWADDDTPTPGQAN